MSRRNMKKVFGATSLPSPEGSEDDFEPQFASSVPSATFGELSLSSHSETQQDSITDKMEEEGACAVSVKPQKKKKKKRNKGKLLESFSSQNDENELDEIDRSVMEVNALLGSPSPATSSVEQSNTNPHQRLMSIQNKYLNAENEMRRFLGQGMPVEERRRRQRLQRAPIFKKNIIINCPDKSLNFHEYGLSMSIESRDGKTIYFTYDHNEQYQKVHRAFLTILQNTNINLLLSMEQILESLHIEGMLEIVDSFFMMEEYNEAELMLEKIISCLQYAAHPIFTLRNPDIRLEYKYLENRPFFTAILRYIYLLSNKSCHRTAFELAKLLLNLDPSDPLKMFLIIDIVALRAREHQWLVDVIDTLKGEKKYPELIVNLKYSYALARFHVALKKHDMSEIDKLLQETILHCPAVAKAILDCFSGIPKDHFQNHYLFNDLINKYADHRLLELIKLYAKMVCAKWREPKVLKWFLKNVNYIIDTFSPEMEAMVIMKSREQAFLLLKWPSEVVRHMTAIKAMSELISDGAVPPVKRASAANPVPPLGTIDRYNYSKTSQQANQNMNPVWQDFFTSAIPRNINIAGIRPHWLALRNTRDYFHNLEKYFLNKEGSHYLAIPGSLMVFSMYLIIVAIAFKTISDIPDDLGEIYEFPEDAIELD